MTHDLVVARGRLVSSEGVVEADIGVRDGRIVTIGFGLEGETRVDARGAFVLPGLVDPHVHPIHAETFTSASEAAVHGGVTTVFHHLYTPPEGDPVPFVAAAVIEAERASHVDFAFHVRLNDLARTHSSIPVLVQQGHTSFKVFMAYGGRGIMVGDDELLQAMGAIEAEGGTLLVHAENGHMADMLEARLRASSGPRLQAYYASRPRWVESEAVGRVAHLLRAQTCPTYFVHLTCTESLEVVAKAKLAGLPVIAETCPHYLLLTADEVAGLGARAKMAPPLRDPADRDALWTALANGLIDTIGSDHSAFVRSEKDDVEDLFDAGFGVPGIATMLPLLFDRGVRSGKVSIERLVDAMATAPARVLGVGERKGSLAIGRDADFVVFDPELPFEIGAGSEHGNGYYSLYEGWRGRGAVRSVYQRGLPLLLDGSFVGAAGAGRLLERGPSARGARR